MACHKYFHKWLSSQKGPATVYDYSENLAGLSAQGGEREGGGATQVS